MNMDRKLVRINHGQRVVRLNTARVQAEGDDEDDTDIIKLMPSTKKFATGGPPVVRITTVLAPNGSRS